MFPMLFSAIQCTVIFVKWHSSALLLIIVITERHCASVHVSKCFQPTMEQKNSNESIKTDTKGIFHRQKGKVFVVKLQPKAETLLKIDGISRTATANKVSILSVTEDSTGQSDLEQPVLDNDMTFTPDHVNVKNEQLTSNTENEPAKRARTNRKRISNLSFADVCTVPIDLEHAVQESDTVEINPDQVIAKNVQLMLKRIVGNETVKRPRKSRKKVGNLSAADVSTVPSDLEQLVQENDMFDIHPDQEIVNNEHLTSNSVDEIATDALKGRRLPRGRNLRGLTLPERNMVLSCVQFCLLEKEKREVVIPLNDAYKRVAIALNVSVSTVAQIAHEFKNTGTIKVPKIKRPSKSRNPRQDTAIREVVEKMYAEGKPVSLSKLKSRLEESEIFKGSKPLLLRRMNRLGYVYKRLERGGVYVDTKQIEMKRRKTNVDKLTMEKCDSENTDHEYCLPAC